jgi:phage-related protein
VGIAPGNVKELVWIASSRRDMRVLPKSVRRTFGVALWAGDEGERTMKRDYKKSSGNVFADLGFRNSKQELLKAKSLLKFTSN